MRVFVPRFLGALAYLLGVTVVGVLGYMAIEGWQAQEALYMTVITITAVGFSEVYPLSELGRDPPVRVQPGSGHEVGNG